MPLKVQLKAKMIPAVFLETRYLVKILKIVDILKSKIVKKNRRCVDAKCA